MKRMRQDEDKTGMDKIKENEAAYNLKEYDSDRVMRKMYPEQFRQICQMQVSKI